MYFARVFATTSSGSGGGGLFLSQPVVSSQSRTNCLSNDGCAASRLVPVGGPEPRAVGRQHFVDQDDLAAAVAEFELRVGDDDAPGRGVLGGPGVDVEAAAAQLVGRVSRRRSRTSARTEC